MADHGKQALPLTQVWRVHASTGAAVKVYVVYDAAALSLGVLVDGAGGASCALTRDEAERVRDALTEALLEDVVPS